jgi:hypothetical protein
LIQLTDGVEIEASPDEVVDWLAHLSDNYRAWHTDHVGYRYLQGTSLWEVGAVAYAEEYLHGELHGLKLRTTRVVPNSRVEYGGFGMKCSFEVKPMGRNVLFVAEIALGLDVPVLGWFVDRILLALLSEQIEAIQRHMVEEGENIKRLLET